MAATPIDDPKPNYTNDDTGEAKPPAPLPWTPPGDRRPPSRAGISRRPRRAR